MTRNDYVDLLSSFRSYGVEVSSKEFGLKFSFAVDDLLDIAPLSSRPEIESISMSSPGEIILIISGGILVTKQAINLLVKIIDALKRKEEIKEKKIKHFYDYSVALDSFVGALRNAGFENNELKKLVRNVITKDIDTITRFISLGNIESISLSEIKSEHKIN